MSGIVATEPKLIKTNAGLEIAGFRLASRGGSEQARRNDETSWYTVSGYRTLAQNIASSIKKGDRVLVTGTLQVNDWDNDTRRGTTAEIEAVTLGHDLRYGTSDYTHMNDRDAKESAR